MILLWQFGLRLAASFQTDTKDLKHSQHVSTMLTREPRIFLLYCTAIKMWSAVFYTSIMTKAHVKLL